MLDTIKERIENGNLITKEEALNIAKSWCDKNEVAFVRYIDSGGFGHAFEIENSKVLKITSSLGEAAFSYDASNEEINGYVKTYSVQRLNNKLFFIVMDLLNMDSNVQEASNGLFEVINQIDHDILSDEDISHLLSDEENVILEDIKTTMIENKSNFQMLDVHEENIGYDDYTSSYVIIDQFHLNFSREEYLQKINLIDL